MISFTLTVFPVPRGCFSQGEIPFQPSGVIIERTGRIEKSV